MKLAATRLKGRNNVLGRRLQQRDDVADELVLALDFRKSIELVLTYVDSFLYISRFEAGKGLVLFLHLLEELGRRVARVGAKQRSRAVKHRINFAEVEINALQSFVKQSVLYNDEFDVVLETSFAQFACSLSVESCSFCKIEATVAVESLFDLVNYDCFIFLFHFLVSLNGLNVNALGVNLYTGTHCARKINALDICTLGCGGFELDKSVDELAGIVFHLLGGK